MEKKARIIFYALGQKVGEATTDREVFDFLLACIKSTDGMANTVSFHTGNGTTEGVYIDATYSQRDDTCCYTICGYSGESEDDVKWDIIDCHDDGSLPPDWYVGIVSEKAGGDEVVVRLVELNS